jgi:hypothetical protein
MQRGSENGCEEEEEVAAAEKQMLGNSKQQRVSPQIRLRRRKHGLRCGVKSGSDKPTNGRKNWKFTALPMCVGQLLVKSI